MQAVTEDPGLNPDPITNEAGSHPLGTGVGGALGGAIAGAAIGTLAGPLGTAIGAAVGAVAGGFAGKAVAESVNPSVPSDVLTARDLVSTQPASTFEAISHSAIEKRAYEFWEKNGHADGHALDDWLVAESTLHAETYKE